MLQSFQNVANVAELSKCCKVLQSLKKIANVAELINVADLSKHCSSFKCCKYCRDLKNVANVAKDFKKIITNVADLTILLQMLQRL